MISLNDIKELIELENKYRQGGHHHEYLRNQFKLPDDNDQHNSIEQYGCSYWAKFLITMNAGTCHYTNARLREEKWLKCDQFVAKYKVLLNQALDEIKSYNDQTVWRWVNFEEEGFQYLKNFKGQKIMFPEFLSTSKYRNTAYPTFLKISTSTTKSNGKHIGIIVNKELAEQEVLFKSNSCFLIIRIEDNVIHVKEIESDDIDLILYQNFWYEVM